MGCIVRLKPKRLKERLDAVYYQPTFLKNEERLKNSSVQILRLKQLVSHGRRAIYFDTQTMELGEAPKLWVPFLTADDFSRDGFFINLNSRRRVSPDFASNYPNGKLRANELLVKVKGPNQITAYNKDEPEDFVLVSGTIWGGLVKTEKVDPHYLVTALSSQYAVIARSRLRTNTNVEFLAPDDLLELELPIPENQEAQTYIGNKVRQAERLRERSSDLKQEVDETFLSVGLNQKVSFLQCDRVPPNVIFSRLDHLHYRSDLLENLGQIQSFTTVKLGNSKHFINLSDGDHGNPVYGNGPIYIRASEINSNRFSEATAVRLDTKYAATIADSCWANSGDVVFSIVGTLGLVSVISPETEGIMSRGVAKVTPVLLPTYYVKALMRSLAFSRELLRHSVGTIQRGVYLENLSDIQIPIIEQSLIDLISLKEETADVASLFSEKLILAAKFLVEALIEGNITELELQEAQEAIQQRDYTLDRQILSRLTRKGIPRRGEKTNEPSLFPNLDALYRALLGDNDAEDDSDWDSAPKSRQRWRSPIQLLPRAAEASTSYQTDDSAVTLLDEEVY